MNQLQLSKPTATIDSRTVAVMVDKRHSDLLRDIEIYIGYINQPIEANVFNERNFASVEFFAESSYRDEKGEARKHYLLTKKGCELVANKLTGAKGIQFTAQYVTKFNEMEQAQRPQLSPLDQLRLQVQIMTALEEKVTAVESKVDSIKDILAINTDTWRDDAHKIMLGIAKIKGGTEYVRETYGEAYSLLERRAHSNLERRYENRIQRMFRNGESKTAVNKLSKLDIIDADSKLIEIFTAIVKDLAIKYGYVKTA